MRITCKSICLCLAFPLVRVFDICLPLVNTTFYARFKLQFGGRVEVIVRTDKMLKTANKATI